MQHPGDSMRTQRNSPTTPAGLGCDPEDLLQRLLVMAREYRAEGDIQSAMDLYWLLAEEHPESPQATAAKEALLMMAEGYERRRAPFMARSIYERLLTDATR